VNIFERNFETTRDDMSNSADKNACGPLDADHIAVKHLFVDHARLAAASDIDASQAERTALAMKICDELTVHSQIEEEIFYPALREALANSDDLLDEAFAQNQEAKELIADIHQRVERRHGHLGGRAERGHRTPCERRARRVVPQGAFSAGTGSTGPRPANARAATGELLGQAEAESLA
jgi:hemerythrin superfamily protein